MKLIKMSKVAGNSMSPIHVIGFNVIEGDNNSWKLQFITSEQCIITSSLEYVFQGTVDSIHCVTHSGSDYIIVLDNKDFKSDAMKFLAQAIQTPYSPFSPLKFMDIGKKVLNGSSLFSLF